MVKGIRLKWNLKGLNSSNIFKRGTKMSVPRKIYEFLKKASEAHGKWDYEVSMNIIRNPKRLLILLVILLLILLIMLIRGEL